MREDHRKIVNITPDLPWFEETMATLSRWESPRLHRCRFDFPEESKRKPWYACITWWEISPKVIRLWVERSRPDDYDGMLGATEFFVEPRNDGQTPPIDNNPEQAP